MRRDAFTIEGEGIKKGYGGRSRGSRGRQEMACSSLTSKERHRKMKRKKSK